MNVQRDLFDRLEDIINFRPLLFFLELQKKKVFTKNKKTLDIFYCSVQYPVPLLGFKYSETSLQRTPSGPQNSVRYREVSAT